MSAFNHDRTEETAPVSKKRSVQRQAQHNVVTADPFFVGRETQQINNLDTARAQNELNQFLELSERMPIPKRVELPSTSKVLVVGDIDGDASALDPFLSIAESYLSLNSRLKPYVIFLGNFLAKSETSTMEVPMQKAMALTNAAPETVKVLCDVLSLYMRYPRRVYLLRGYNERDDSIDAHTGLGEFKSQIKEACGRFPEAIHARVRGELIVFCHRGVPNDFRGKEEGKEERKQAETDAAQAKAAEDEEGTEKKLMLEYMEEHGISKIFRGSMQGCDPYRVAIFRHGDDDTQYTDRPVANPNHLPAHELASIPLPADVAVISTSIARSNLATYIDKQRNEQDAQKEKKEQEEQKQRQEKQSWVSLEEMENRNQQKQEHETKKVKRVKDMFYITIGAPLFDPPQNLPKINRPNVVEATLLPFTSSQLGLGVRQPEEQKLTDFVRELVDKSKNIIQFGQDAILYAVDVRGGVATLSSFLESLKKDGKLDDSLSLHGDVSIIFLADANRESEFTPVLSIVHDLFQRNQGRVFLLTRERNVKDRKLIDYLPHTLLAKVRDEQFAFCADDRDGSSSDGGSSDSGSSDSGSSDGGSGSSDDDVSSDSGSSVSSGDNSGVSGDGARLSSGQKNARATIRLPTSAEEADDFKHKFELRLTESGSFESSLGVEMREVFDSTPLSPRLFSRVVQTADMITTSNKTSQPSGFYYVTIRREQERQAHERFLSGASEIAGGFVSGIQSLFGG